MKYALIIAGILIVLGCALFVTALASNNWDITTLNNNRYQSNTYSIDKTFQNIAIDTDTADISLVLTEDDTCRVVCYESEKLTYSVHAKDGTLTISSKDGRKWYEYITFFSFGAPKITLYLPQGEYNTLNITGSTGIVDIPKDFQFAGANIRLSTGNIKYCASVQQDVMLRTSTGHIAVDGITVGDLSVTVSTGKVTLTNVQCQNLQSEGDTGDLQLENVIASGKFSIERSTGDITLDRCDAAEIEIETDTGDVSGNLLSPKIFLTETDTGRVNVSKSTTGGRCQIETDTGNIKITTP